MNFILYFYVVVPEKSYSGISCFLHVFSLRLKRTVKYFGRTKNEYNRWPLLYPFTLACCPVLTISLGNPYMKILDYTKRFVADAPISKKE